MGYTTNLNWCRIPAINSMESKPEAKLWSSSHDSFLHFSKHEFDTQKKHQENNPPVFFTLLLRFPGMNLFGQERDKLWVKILGTPVLYRSPWMLLRNLQMKMKLAESKVKKCEVPKQQSSAKSLSDKLGILEEPN